MRILNIHLIIVLSIFFLFTHQGWGSEWKFRGLLPRGMGYYDKNSIKKVNRTISQVWTVTIYNAKGKSDAFSILKKQDKAPDNPEILSQELVLLEFDCANEKYRITAIDIYDATENLLLSVPEVDDTWHDIIPDSINEKLKNVVCSAGENSKNKK